MLSLYFDKLMGKIEEHERKKYLLVDDYMLNKVLDKIKEIISIEKFNTRIQFNTKIMIQTINFQITLP